LCVSAAHEAATRHGLGGGGEEVSPAVPVLHSVPIHEAKVGLVNQCRGLEGLPRLLLGQFLRRQLAQFVVDQRQQLRGSVRIAGFDARQDASNFVHGRHQGACSSRRNVPMPLREWVGEFLIFVRV
jgi:hypothetical protein